MRYTARCPLRVDLAGGWSCLPAVAGDVGGTAVCAAVKLYAEGSIAVPAGTGFLASLRSDRRTVTYTLDLPIGAGLGEDAAQTVLWVALLRSVIDNAADRAEVARSSCRIDTMLGTLRGEHDAHACALGGVTSLAVASGVAVERLDESPAVRDEMNARLVLVWTGEAGDAPGVGAALQDRWRRGDRVTVDGVTRLKEGATHMRDALHAGDFDSAVELIDEQWRLERTLEPGIALPATREIETIVRAHGAVAVKQCGIAGGVLAVFARPGNRQHLISALRARKLRVLPSEIDPYGVYLFKG